MKRAAILITAVIMVCRLAWSDEPAPSSEHLKFFERYVGTWAMQGALEEDTLFGKKGDQGSASITWRWVYDKSAVEWEWVFEYGGRKSGTKGLMSWDASRNCVVGLGVASIGGYVRVTSRTTDPFTVFVEGELPDGTAGSQVETFTLAGDDTLIMQATERKLGAVIGEGRKDTFTRVTPTDQEPGPNYQHLKPMEWLVGEWTCEMKLPVDVEGVGVKGDPLKVAVTHEWALKKNFQLVKYDGDLPGTRIADRISIVGWDAEKQQAFVDSYDQRGGISRSSLTIDDSGTLTFDSRGVGADGTVGEASLTLKRIDDDTFAYSFGEGQPGQWSMEFKRRK